MVRFSALPIGQKLTFLLLFVAGLVLAAVTFANVTFAIQDTRQSMVTQYSTLARIVAAQSGAALSIADIDSSGAQEVLADLAAVPTVRFAALYNSGGREVVHFPADSQSLQPPADPGAHFAGGFLDVVEEVRLEDGSLVGRLYLRVTTEQLNQEIQRTLVISVILLALALLAAFGLSLALQRVVTGPILQLLRLTQKVATSHDYTLQVEKASDDELGQLCEAFNRMLAEVRKRDAELAQHRQELEEQVKQRTQVLEDRTKELTTSNEELTHSREELQAANKELEAFSYSVSHDLRAPLRAIDGFSRIMIEDYLDQLPLDAQEYLRDIRAGAQRMGHLVDDLLAFSRLSRQALRKTKISTNSLVKQCLTELRGEYDGRKVEFQIADLPDCSGDQGLMKQVWTNLLSNAIKYSSKREVAVIEVGVRPAESGGKQVYYVKDNGVGFDMKYANKLFGVFQRLHRAEEFAGTGVGLAIVQRIVHRHGGEVWADSKPDMGATMSFTLDEGGLDE